MFNWLAVRPAPAAGDTPHPHYSHTELPERVDHLARCTCAALGFDDIANEAGRVAALINAGVPMREACLLVWGTEREARRAAVRQSFRTRWPDLELPDWEAS